MHSFILCVCIHVPACTGMPWHVCRSVDNLWALFPSAMCVLGIGIGFSGFSSKCLSPLRSRIIYGNVYDVRSKSSNTILFASRVIFFLNSFPSSKSWALYPPLPRHLLLLVSPCFLQSSEFLRRVASVTESRTVEGR